MIYVLAYPEVEPRVAQRIDRFRARHEPDRAKLVPAHITLVFASKPDHRDRISALCDAASRETAEISIAFDGREALYDPFEKTHKLCLMCGAGKAALTALHARLYEGPHRAALSPEIPYRPHMTVATQADTSLIERLDIADIGDFPISGTVKALELVELADGGLNTLERFPLQR